MITPDLQASLLCEDVRQEISGSHTLVGVFNVIPAPTVPINMFKLCLWTRWGGGTGEYMQDSYIVAPDDTTRVAHAQVRFKLTQMDSHATNVHIFGGVQLHSFGVYHIEIHLDGQLRMRYPVPVVPAKQQHPPKA